MPEGYVIRSVRGPADLADAARLFGAYVASLGVDLSYQGVEAELAGLPGAYAPPAGEILLARALDGTSDGAAFGCVALRPLNPPDTCEMKRLTVTPAARGLGLGRALVRAAVAAAERIGYREMRLDTLPFMDAAIALYRAEGFGPVAPYYDTPVAGTVFLARALGDRRIGDVARAPGV